MTRRKETVPTQCQIALAVLLGILAVATDPERTAAAMESESGREVGRIVRLDPRLDRLLPPGARLEKIADGLQWVEGPAWNSSEGYLLFSDIPQNAVYRWDPDAGLSLFLKPSGYNGDVPFAGREPGSNGLVFDSLGRLVLAEHGNRRIARLESNGSKTTGASRSASRPRTAPGAKTGRFSTSRRIQPCTESRWGRREAGLPVTSWLQVSSSSL